MKPLSMAVIGAGHLGRIHARLLSQAAGLELVAVADPVAAARNEAAAGRAEPVADYRDLFGRIDAAVIATPTRLHREVALALIAQGIHVFVEKPIASTTAEADEMVAAARGKGVVLQVGHVERFNPVWKSLAGHPELVAQPRYLEAVRAAPYTFRSTDVSVVLDLMVHDIDIALSLVGSPVVRVDAVGHAVLGPHDDLASARLTFANGAVANLTASRVSYEAQRRMRVFTATGYASLDFAARTATLVTPSPQVAGGKFDGDSLSGEEKNKLKDRFFSDVLSLRQLPAAEGNAIADELADFADSIRNARRPKVTGEDGRDALDVCEQVAAQIAKWQAGDRARTLHHPAAHQTQRRQAG